MAAAFSRTRHALIADRRRGRWAGMGIAVLLIAWFSWLVLGRVTLYQTSDRARIEVARAAHPVAPTVDGRVVQNHLVIGNDVNEGDILVELDAEAERRQLEESRVRRENWLASQRSLLLEIAAEEEALRLADAAAQAEQAEADAHILEAEADERLAAAEEKITALLRAKQAVSEVDFLRDQAKLESSRATLQSKRAARLRVDHDRSLERQERVARLTKLNRDATDLAGSAAVEEATLARLDYAIACRAVRAPVSGTLGEVAEVRAGSVVRAAEKLAMIVPRDRPRAVAYFSPRAVGRLAVGQTAQMRLEAYPWTQFGTVSASVVRVGNEATNGLIRVEFELHPVAGSAIPLTHGLPGAMEVAVEVVSPADVVLRAAGQYLAPRAPAADGPTAVAASASRDATKGP